MKGPARGRRQVSIAWFLGIFLLVSSAISRTLFSRRRYVFASIVTNLPFPVTIGAGSSFLLSPLS